jgi:F0F1-type ATP synthase membrane subunit a
MTLAHFRRHRFQNFSAAVLVLAVLLFLAVLASPPQAAGNVDCQLWFSVCMPMTFAHWCTGCLMACIEAYVFCLSYLQE